MSESILVDHRHIWQSKPILRTIYNSYYERIVSNCLSGLSLEVGGGSGNLKEYLPEVISSDIVSLPWLDIVSDAQQLSFTDNVFNNIVLVDVLHHIEKPVLFIKEALRVLKNGGRIVMIEPAITPLSYVFYQWFHNEPVDLDDDPFAESKLDPNRQPFDANQAIPSLLFGQYAEKLTNLVPNVSISKLEYFDFFAYPLSGGFRKWSLLPNRFAVSILNAERKIQNFYGKFGAFRMMIVLEKRDC